MASRDGSTETFPWKIEKLDDLSPVLAQAVGQEFSNLPHAVFCPGSNSWISKSPPRVVALDEDRILVFQQRRAKAEVQSFPFKEIRAWETGGELLVSWVAFYFAGEWRDLFAEDRVTLEYNSVGRDLFEPFTEAYLRAHASGFEASDSLEARAALEAMIKKDYRYYSYPNQALRGRTVQAVFYHARADLLPEGFWQTFLSKFARRVLASYLAALSERHLVTFSRTPWNQVKNPSGHAMILRWVPLTPQVRLSVGSETQGFRTVAVDFDGDPLFFLPVSELFWPTFRAFAEISRLVVEEEKN